MKFDIDRLLAQFTDQELADIVRQECDYLGISYNRSHTFAEFSLDELKPNKCYSIPISSNNIFNSEKYTKTDCGYIFNKTNITMTSTSSPTIYHFAFNSNFAA